MNGAACKVRWKIRRKAIQAAGWGLLCLWCLQAAALAQDEEHYFRFTIKDRSEIRRLTRLVSIDNVLHDTVYAYANASQWKAFLTLGYHPVELTGTRQGTPDTTQVYTAPHRGRGRQYAHHHRSGSHGHRRCRCGCARAGH